MFHRSYGLRSGDSNRLIGKLRKGQAVGSAKSYPEVGFGKEEYNTRHLRWEVRTTPDSTVPLGINVSENQNFLHTP